MAYERGSGDQLRTPHRIGILAAGWTGVIHVALWLGVVEPSPGPMSPLGISFLMAGITFFTGAYLVRANMRRRIVYLLGIPFTAGQISSGTFSISMVSLTCSPVLAPSEPLTKSHRSFSSPR